MKSIPEEIETLRQMSTADLIARYREVYAKEPHVRRREWLWKRIAWRIQEIQFGGLSTTAKKKLETLISEIDLPIHERQRTVSGKIKAPGNSTDLPVGTLLTRTWHGKDIRVHVVEGGFEHEGVVYKTLSGAAKAITGQHWNGRLFFGLTTRKKGK